MRLLLYNIRYATGMPHKLLPLGGYLKRTEKKLNEISLFIKESNPDIVGLVEVDSGSYRSKRKNQAEEIANHIGHYHSYASKYHKESSFNILPMLNKQGNAFLTRDSISNETFHYFDKGAKRLVIELEMENLTIFLVHLALGFRVRHHQLADLYHMVEKSQKPTIVAGDFNALWGDREIRLFLAATGLVSANIEGLPSFPSWKPKRELDFILHSPEIVTTSFSIPDITHSDHLPLLYDFEISEP